MEEPLAFLTVDWTLAAVVEAYREHGYTMKEIADHLGVHYATVSRRLRKHEPNS